VAPGAAVGQPRANGFRAADVADAVVGDRSLPLQVRELPLEELPAAPDGAERVAGDDVVGGVDGVPVATTGANLLGQRQGNPGLGRVWRLGAVRELASDRRRRDRGSDARGNQDQAANGRS
jgi:hypothetical protein